MEETLSSLLKLITPDLALSSVIDLRGGLEMICSMKTWFLRYEKSDEHDNSSLIDNRPKLTGTGFCNSSFVHSFA